MNGELISSAKNPKIINLRKLVQRKQRWAQQRFMVEGLQLIGMAVEAGRRPLDIFYCPEQFAGETASNLLAQLLERGGQPYPVTERVMSGLSERDAPQGIIVTFPLFETALETLLHKLDHPSLLVILDRLQDPGNLGALIRTADAVAAEAVILLEPCVDVFDPKTVRGSMGSIFALPIVYATDLASLFKTLRQHHFRLTGADSHRGDFPWEASSQAISGSVALVLGNEARGLSSDARPYMTDWVRLPILGKAESLNVAVAGAVLMYQWLQRNKKL